MLDSTQHGALTALVADLEQALIARDPQAVADLFLETGFWRDLAALTWNLRTCEGRGQIRDMAAAQLDTIRPQKLYLDPPALCHAMPEGRKMSGLGH